MKKSYLLLGAGLLAMTAAFPAAAQDAAPQSFKAVADVNIRQDSPSAKTGSSNKIETVVLESKDDAGNVTGYNSFVGLVGFDFTVPAGQKIVKAELRLVTERYKGMNEESLRLYSNDFTEDATWESEQAYYEVAKAQNPVMKFTPAGQKNKAIFDNNLTEEFQSASAWVNMLDVTDALTSLAPGKTRVNFMLTQDQEEGKKSDQNCFYSHDAAGSDANANYPDMGVLSADEACPLLTLTYAEDKEVSTEELTPQADTTVRSNSVTWHQGTATGIEIYWDGREDAENPGSFYGLMKFGMPADVKNGKAEITTATLRLVTRRVKGDRNVSVYAYNTNFDETANYETEGTKVEAALATEPILKYEVKGQGDKDMAIDELSDDFKTAAAWTNTLDITEYAKANTQGIGLLFSKDKGDNQQYIINTKENVGNIVNSKDANVVFAAADVVPVMTITYKKIATTDPSGIENVDAELENVPAEYYNLQGMRVAEPQKGVVYIVRQGSKAKKVIF